MSANEIVLTKFETHQSGQLHRWSICLDRFRLRWKVSRFEENRSAHLVWFGWLVVRVLVGAKSGVEASILLREFKEAGFDCVALGENPMFQAALSQYGKCELSRDKLFALAEKLAIFDPSLKP